MRHDRNRLSNRVRELLWRYYLQLLELTDDVAASQFLNLWRLVPTPAKTARVRETLSPDRDGTAWFERSQRMPRQLVEHHTLLHGVA